MFPWLSLFPSVEHLATGLAVIESFFRIPRLWWGTPRCGVQSAQRADLTFFHPCKSMSIRA